MVDCNVNLHEICMKFMKQRIYQVFFNLSMIVKGIDGVIELAGGLAFIFLNRENILNLLSHIYDYNMLDISNHTFLSLATAVSKAFETNVKNFIIVILVCNGFVKIGMSISLFMRYLKVFPVALVFLSVLFVYQIVQLFYTPSLFLILFNVFDALVILVIWAEYNQLKKSRKFQK